MNLKLTTEFKTLILENFHSTEERKEVLDFFLEMEVFKANNEDEDYQKIIHSNGLFVPSELWMKLRSLNIFSDEDNEIFKLKIRIFEDEETSDTPHDKFAWIKEFRALFKEANPLRDGTLSSTKERMKKFFSENPDVRKDEIMGAVKLYLQHTASAYVMKAHKFIYDGAGVNRNSTLEEWLEKYRTYKQLTDESPQANHITDKMQ